jgi:hypothetical protein
MEKHQTFKLIDGQFDPSEAKNILFALINSKIHFHSLESFGITVRSNGDVSVHEKRIKELREANIDMNRLLDLAEKSKMQVKVNSVITIEFVNAEKNSTMEI